MASLPLIAACSFAFASFSCCSNLGLQCPTGAPLQKKNQRSAHGEKNKEGTPKPYWTSLSMKMSNPCSILPRISLTTLRLMIGASMNFDFGLGVCLVAGRQRFSFLSRKQCNHFACPAYNVFWRWGNIAMHSTTADDYFTWGAETKTAFLAPVRRISMVFVVVGFCNLLGWWCLFLFPY